LKNASPFTAVLRVPLFTRQRMGTRLFPELGNVKAVRKRSAPILSYIFSGTSWLCNSQFSTRPTADVSTVYLAGTLTVLCFPPETEKITMFGTNRNIHGAIKHVSATNPWCLPNSEYTFHKSLFSNETLPMRR